MDLRGLKGALVNKMSLLISRIIITIIFAAVFGFALKLVWTRNVNPLEWFRKPIEKIIPEVETDGVLTVMEPSATYEAPSMTVDDTNKDVEKLDDYIVDVNKGYMRIRVSADFLNSDFDVPVTLKYEGGRYEPVTITFKNDPEKGAGIIVTSPEWEGNIAIYLNEHFRYVGFGTQTYTKDLVFSLYFNKQAVYMVTESGEIQHLNQPKENSYKLPTISYGRNILVAPFNPDDLEAKKNAEAEVEELEKYFKTYQR